MGLDKTTKRFGLTVMHLLVLFSFAAILTGAGRIMNVKVATLEYEDIWDRSVKLHGDILEVRGFVSHSSLGIKKVRTYQSNDVLYVKAGLAMAEKDVSGKVEINLKIDEQISEVRFGNQEEIIWSRLYGTRTSPSK